MSCGKTHCSWGLVSVLVGHVGVLTQGQATERFIGVPSQPGSQPQPIVPLVIQEITDGPIKIDRLIVCMSSLRGGHCWRGWMCVNYKHLVGC